MKVGIKRNESRGKILKVNISLPYIEGSVKSTERRQGRKAPYNVGQYPTTEHGGKETQGRLHYSVHVHWLHDTFCNQCSVIFLFQHVP